MFKNLYYAALAVIGLSCFSCSEDSRLAAEIDGAWSGNAQRVEDPDAVSTSILDTYSFTREENTQGGTLIIAGLMSSERALPQTDEAVEPITFTASGQVSVSGTWDVTDDDEIIVALDPKSIEVTVAPEGITLRQNMLDGQTAPALDSIRPQLSASVRADFTRVAEEHLLAIRKLDDVKVKNQTLTFEHDGQRMVLRRQGASEGD